MDRIYGSSPSVSKPENWGERGERGGRHNGRKGRNRQGKKREACANSS